MRSVQSSAVTGLFAVAIVAIGCDGVRVAPDGVAREESIDMGSPANAGGWLFWPTSLRVYPLSRANPTADPPSLDVRLEFLDKDGGSTRAVGTVVIVLRCASAEPQEVRSVYPLVDRRENAAHHDPVTDTYRFTVVPRWTKVPPSGSAINVDAYLYGLDGARPAAQGRIVW